MKIYEKDLDLKIDFNISFVRDKKKCEAKPWNNLSIAIFEKGIEGKTHC